MQYGVIDLIYQLDYVADTEKVLRLNTKSIIDSSLILGKTWGKLYSKLLNLVWKVWKIIFS